MFQQHSNTTCSLILGIDGDLQVVHQTGAQTVRIDIQAHRDSRGDLKREHYFIRLSYESVCELRTLLDHIDEPADPRQAALWSLSTFIEPIELLTRNRRPLRVAQ